MAPLDMSSSSAAPTFVPTGPACALPLLLSRASTSSCTKQDGNGVIPALQLLDGAVLDLAFATSTACGVPQPCAASAAVGLQQLASVGRSADETKDEDDLDLIINTSAFASEVGGALLLHRCSSPRPSSVDDHGATSDHSEQLALSTCNWDEVLQPVPHGAFTLHQEEEEEQEELAADLLLPSAAEEPSLTDLEDGEEGSPSPSTTTSSLHEAASEHVDSAPATSSGAPHVVVQLRRQSVVHRPALLGTKRVWATASPPPAPAPAPARQHKQQPQQEQEEEGAGPVVPAPAPVLVHPTPVLRSKKRTAAAAGAGAKGQAPLQQQGVAAWHASAAALASGPRPTKRACVQH